jgi:hypothetical protein
MLVVLDTASARLVFDFGGFFYPGKAGSYAV